MYEFTHKNLLHVTYIVIYIALIPFAFAEKTLFQQPVREGISVLGRGF
jgi:hypothetical protein